jgi:hypothetical protein
MEQFKRMQKLAGLITEGEAAYEYEKGKAAGEKVEKKKMKKSELKKQIKEMILAEMNIDLSNDDKFYDFLAEGELTADSLYKMFEKEGLIDDRREYDEEDLMAAYPGLSQSEAEKLVNKISDGLNEAKKKKKDEEVEDVEIDTDIDMGDEMDMGTEMDTTSVPAASDVQKELMDALEAAKASGDEKLVRQIGNALTYFTRSQVSKDENPPSMNEEISMEAIDRLEGLANMQDLAVLKAKLRILSSDWMQDGFEKEDIIEYITELINQI